LLKQLDEELDRLIAGWRQTLLDNLEDPTIQENLDPLKPAARISVEVFLSMKALPDPVTGDFASAIQDAPSGLEKVNVGSDDIKATLLQGGSPATLEDLRKRFEAFLNDRCKGKDTTKLRSVVE
jgi:Family of unknown function (DUF6079)